MEMNPGAPPPAAPAAPAAPPAAPAPAAPRPSVEQRRIGEASDPFQAILKLSREKEVTWPRWQTLVFVGLRSRKTKKK